MNEKMGKTINAVWRWVQDSLKDQEEGQDQRKIREGSSFLSFITYFLKPSGLLLGPWGGLNENGRLVYLNARRHDLIGEGLSLREEVCPRGSALRVQKPMPAPVSFSASSLRIRYKFLATASALPAATFSTMIVLARPLIL